MKLLLILFIFFAFTKEKIIYKSNKIYSNDIKCINIESFFDSGKQPDDYPLNAQYCRLNDPNITQLTENISFSSDSDVFGDSIEPSFSSVSVGRLRNLENSQLNKDKCCYISILPNSDNSDWIYFCGKINSTVYGSGVSEYVKQIKNGDDFKNKYKDLKIDCFSQKLDFMINFLIISLIYLI